jgi:hypothetical protein
MVSSNIAHARSIKAAAVFDDLLTMVYQLPSVQKLVALDPWTWDEVVFGSIVVEASGRS